MATAERDRLDEADARGVPWRRWGPYLSERQWGTVREDTTEGGDSWSAFTHDQARARAHRWGEDGLAGLVGVLPPLFREMDQGRLLAPGGGASVPQPRRRPRAQAKAAR